MSENKKKCEICKVNLALYVSQYNCFDCESDCAVFYCQDCNSAIILPNRCIGCERDTKINKILD